MMATSLLPMINAARGAVSAATNAPSEDSFETKAVNNQMAAAHRPTGQAVASRLPKNVATPLPPLKPSHTE